MIDHPLGTSPRQRQMGFTLAEVLIVIVIMSIVGGGLVAIMRQMGIFYRHNEDAVYAMQTLRASTEFMATELRMESPEDLLLATPDSVAVRFHVAFGVVCDSTAADEATMYIYDRVLNASVTGTMVGISFSGPFEAAWYYADNWNPSPTATGGGPKADCTALGAPSTLPSSDYMRMTGWTAQYGDVPDRGSLMRGYVQLTYHIAPSVLGAGDALWRDAQELVSPLSTGAAFSYLMVGGGVQNTVASADLDDVRAVRFTAQAVGDGPNEFNVQRDITFDIPLRN